MKQASTEARNRERELGKLLNDGRPRSEFELLCIERQRKDLLHGHERGLQWDEQAAQDVIALFKMMRHWKGKFAGRPILLEPWQDHCMIAPLFGWKRADGTRRFRTSYKELPRKTGKTTIEAGIAIQGLLADDEQGAEVYTTATKREQANICFRDVKNCIGPVLKKYVTIHMHSVFNPRTQGFIQPLSSDYNTLDGLNVSRAIVDEVHAHKTRDFWDVIDSATGSRDQPMLSAITTAGFDRSTICWELRERLRKIVSGDEENDAFFGFLTTLDDGDDWADESVWWKANPNLNVSRSIEDLRDKFANCRDSATAENNFRRKYLNQWTEQSVRWLPMHVWDECGGKSLASDLIGRKCWAGLDLASTRDVNSLVLVFPLDDGHVRLLPFYWVPRGAHDDSNHRDRTQVMNWAARGLIETTDGDTTDYSVIEEAIVSLRSRYDMQGLAFDPWGPAGPMVQSLTRQGMPEKDFFFDFRQTIGNFAAPTKKLEELLISRKLEHGGDAVLRWMAGNVCVYQDCNANIRPDKAKSADKIDGIVASIMALGLWMLKPAQPGPFSNMGIFSV